MNRLEKKYMFIENIVAWGHGKYSKSDLEQMTIAELLETHSKVYNQRLTEINTIRA